MSDLDEFDFEPDESDDLESRLMFRLNKIEKRLNYLKSNQNVLESALINAQKTANSNSLWLLILTVFVIYKFYF